MKKMALGLLLPLALLACTQQPTQDDARTSFGPPANWQGQPNAGMEHFSAGGGWEPGNQSMHPATAGPFKGY